MVIEESSTKTRNFKEFIDSSKEYFFYLLRNWFKIFLITILFSFLGLTYSLLVKPVYKAVFTFALEDDKMTGGALSGALGIASSLGIDLGSSGGGAFSGANLIELMKSRRLVDKTFLEIAEIEGNQKVLGNVYVNLIGLDKVLKKKGYTPDLFNLPNNTDYDKLSVLQDSVLMIIHEHIMKNNILNVYQKDKKVSILTVEVISKSELFSKFFAENLVKNVSQFYVETKSKKARSNVQILQRQSDSVRNELNNAIEGVAIVSDKTFNLNPALNIQRVPSSKRQVDVQANTAILTQLVTNLELAKVSLLRETPLIQIIDKPILPLKKDRPSKLLSFLIAGLFGFFCSVGYFVLLREYQK